MGELEFIPGPPAWIEWNGQRWYRLNKRNDDHDGHYRNPGGDLLHRAVWERANGPIPGGGVIHHRDHDKTNNGISNLQLLSGLSEHLRHHPEKWEHPNWVANSTSDAAKERADRFWANRQPRTVVCDECGTEFQSTGMRTRFCGGTCRARERRRRLKTAAVS